jgi:hypothetical protein
MNWEHELLNPPEKYSDQHDRLMMLAASWDSCACCELNVPKKNGIWNGIPVNPELEKYGRSFYDAILTGNWTKALNLLYKMREHARDLTSGTG